MGRARTKTEVELEARAEAEVDPERAEVLRRARAFKGSWLDLAESLLRVRTQRLYGRWGFEDFEAYCAKELHLRRPTVEKLLGSYSFLRREAPEVARGTAGPLPPYQSLQLLERTLSREDLDDDTKREVRRAVLDEGATPARVSRRLREVAFPADDAGSAPPPAGAARGQRQLAQAARALADLLAEHADAVPRPLAADVEEQLGRLLQHLHAG